jgi:WD40 repeat protein
MPPVPEAPERGVSRRGLLIGGAGAAVGVLAVGAVIATLDSRSGRGSVSGSASASASAKSLGALATPQLLTPEPIGAVYAADILGAGGAPAVAVSPDGKLVAVGYVHTPMDSAAGGFAQVWRVSDGTWVAATKVAGYGALSLAFSPDGKTLAISAGDAVLLWNLESATAPVAAPDVVDVYASTTALAFSPDGKTFASVNSARVQLWSISGTTATATSSIAVGDDRGVVSLTSFLFSPDGTMGAVGVTNLDSKNADGTSRQLTMWEMGSGKQIDRAVPSGGVDDALSIAFSPDGKSIVTASTKVEIWDARGSSAPRATWTAPEADDDSPFADVQYSHSGKYILVVGLSGEMLYLLSATSGKLLATYSVDSLAVTSARFLAKDAGIACCGYGTTDNNPCAWLSRFA